MKRGAGPALILASGVAIACAISAIMTAPVKVNAAQSVGDHWRQIGDELDDQFGQSFRDVELNVKIPVQVCIAFQTGCAPPVETNMNKPCGKTMKESADQIAERADNGGGGGGGGNWPPDFGGGPGSGNPFDSCYNESVTGCTRVGEGQYHCETQEFLECPFGIG